MPMPTIICNEQFGLTDFAILAAMTTIQEVLLMEIFSKLR